MERRTVLTCGEDNVLNIVLGGLISLVVSVLGHQLQAGGLRRRRRREIREEIELLALVLNGDVKRRLETRIGVLLEQYEPSVEARRERVRARVRVGLSLVGATAAGAVCVWAFGGLGSLSTWESALTGAVAGGSGTLLDSALARWALQREQDEAVDALVDAPVAVAAAKVRAPTVTGETP